MMMKPLTTWASTRKINARAAWWTLLVCLILTLAPPDRAKAQFQEDVSVVYGESITFTLTLEERQSTSDASLLLQSDLGLDVEVPAERTDTGFTASVDVTELKLPPVAVLQFRWRLINLRGEVSETGLVIYRYHDNTLPEAWRQATLENTSVFLSHSNDAIAQAALSISAAALRQQGQALQVDTNDLPISIYIYPNLNSLASGLRLHDARIQDWVAAYSIPESRLIMVAVRNETDFRSSLELDIRHEIAHLVIREAAGGGDIPAWFNEGFALSTSPTTDTALEQTLNQSVTNNTLVPMSSLCGTSFSTLAPQEAALAYAQSLSFYQYVLERYGASQTRALYMAYAEGLGCSEGVQRALGIPLEQIETQWLTSTRRSVAEDSGGFSYNALIFVWAISILLALLFVAPHVPRRLIRYYQ